MLRFLTAKPGHVCVAGVGTNQPILDRLLDVFAREPEVCYMRVHLTKITSVSYILYIYIFIYIYVVIQTQNDSNFDKLS